MFTDANLHLVAHDGLNLQEDLNSLSNETLSEMELGVTVSVAATFPTVPIGRLVTTIIGSSLDVAGMLLNLAVFGPSILSLPFCCQEEVVL